MTEAELISTYLQTLDAVNSNFEFWLSATFALIIAFYFASDKISDQMYRIILFLYISMSVLMFARLIEVGLTNESVRAQLEALDAETYISSMAANTVFAMGFWLIMILGTIGTVMFVVSSKKKLSN